MKNGLFFRSRPERSSLPVSKNVFTASNGFLFFEHFTDLKKGTSRISSSQLEAWKVEKRKIVGESRPTREQFGVF